MLDIRGELLRALNNLAGADLTKIGSGIRRDVYRINSDAFGKQYKGKVVKYAQRKETIEDNRKEFSTWMNVKGTKIGNDFCPIRDRSENFEFLVMDYARPISRVRGVETDEMTVRMEREIKLKGETVHDLYDGNFGYHDERGLVVIDYPWGGNFELQS